MKKWIIKEDKNIADVFIEVYGADEEEFFQNILQAFTNIVTDLKKIKTKEKLSFKLKAENLSELVFNFVDRLIYLKDVKNLLFRKGRFLFKKNHQLLLAGELLGEKISDKLPIKIDIKALTHHKFKVKKEKKGLKATLVFDI